VNDLVVDLPISYLSMGENTGERQLAYSKYLTVTVPDYELKLIREAL